MAVTSSKNKPRKRQGLFSPANSLERTGFLFLGIALLIMLLFHGVLQFNKSFIHTYDALIHIFFGAHYAQTWFDPWEPRWYTGFFTVVYPPLSHYLIALSSKLVGLLTGFAFVQLFALLQLTVGLFRTSKLFFGPRAAGYASIALALSSSLTETVHIFGQLPTLLSLGFLLNALPYCWHYLHFGKWSDLIKAILWTGATTAAHHVTTLFGSVFFTGPIVIIALLASFRTPRPHEESGDTFRQRIRRRLYRVTPRLYRTGVFGFWAISSLLIIVFPYWYWSGTDPITQVAIPHGSRANFLIERDLGLIFWLIPWASSLWVFPYAMAKGFLTWRWPVAASLLILSILGTGSTTPIPRFLLGPAFDILTLDRFTFWATILILPFCGRVLESLIHGRLASYMNANFGKRSRYLLLLGLLIGTCAVVLSISTLTRYRKFQPDPIDIAPILNFIDKDEHWRFRYLSLGFGDQMAWLSANTKALTPDGNYHSARRLPELTTAPVERLEGAKYKGVPGLASLEQFLSTPEKYNLKFVFSNDAFYDPLLFFNGWHRLGPLENGIMVWEREDIPPLPERLPRKVWPIYQRIMWGILPMLMPILAYFSLLMPNFKAPQLPWQRTGVAKRLLLLLKEDSLETEVASDWQWWRQSINRLKRGLNFSRRPFSFRLGTSFILAAILILPPAYFYHQYRRAQNKPEVAVLRYWDHLDFKRFPAAYSLLEPRNGLDFERWLLDFSVVGGLRNGFAQLDAIQPEVLAYEGQGTYKNPQMGDRALVQVHLSWLTSLREIKESFTHELLLSDHGWRILAEPLRKTRTQERFIGQTEVSYYRSPRRLSTNATEANDVLDRPRLSLHDARLVSYQIEKTELDLEVEAVFSEDPPVSQKSRDGSTTRFSIIGELSNSDSRPADLSITGILRDKNGQEISRNNVGQLVLHKLLPGERTPFRIDFDSVTEVKHPELVTNFEIASKAVVTSLDLQRDLASWSYIDEQNLHIRAVNLGTQEASIPHALVSLYDKDGIAWLNDGFGLEAIPPREARNMHVPLQLPDDYQVIKIMNPKLDLEQAEQSSTAGSKFDLPPTEQFPPTSPLQSYSVQLHAFYRVN